MKDSRVSQDEWADQLTETETRNVYAVVRGQAVVLMSVTESWSAGSDGQRIVDSSVHGYSYSKTRVVNQYNEKGQLIGATGTTAGEQNSEVWTDIDQNGTIDPGVDVLEDQSSVSAGKNYYVVIGGAAQLVASETETYGARREGDGSFVAITDTGAHGYSKTLSYVTHTYNQLGQLMGAEGGTITEQNSEVWTDTNRDGKIEEGVDAVVDQSTRSQTLNSYAVILGQAVVVKSETTTYGATVENGVFKEVKDKGSHGYIKSFATIEYDFNARGQLIGAVGQTYSESNNEVFSLERDNDGVVVGDDNRNGLLDDGEVWSKTIRVDQSTVSEIINDYHVIQGQAVVGKSVTKSRSAILDPSDAFLVITPRGHGYNYSETTVEYDFNAEGQLTGALGRSVGQSNNQVLTPQRNAGVVNGDTLINDRKDDGEQWISEFVSQPTLSEGETTYTVMAGQAVVLESRTRIWAGVGWGHVHENRTSGRPWLQFFRHAGAKRVQHERATDWSVRTSGRQNEQRCADAPSGQQRGDCWRHDRKRFVG
ncbi:MAG: hypothetical protein IPN90_04305 [Elusimicrobia bacterium]|nr:hypothetical protein [Elusimicrobiota bacterium]